MTMLDLFEKHKKEKCVNCKIENECEMHMTIDRKTRCTYDDEMSRNK